LPCNIEAVRLDQFDSRAVASVCRISKKSGTAGESAMILNFLEARARMPDRALAPH
jgi:hypothetical protein